MGRQRGVVELFAGLGCVAQGFGLTGQFDVLGLTDIDPLARRNALANVPDVPYLLADARQLGGEHLGRLAEGRTIAGIVGCPPCQGFSAAGQRSDSDPRNQLLDDYFRLVAAVQPAFFVMENVPAVLWRPELAAALALLRDGYAVWSGVLNAALYGVPQTRQRAIVIGYRRDLGVQPTCPPPTHGGTRDLFNYRTGAKTRLSDDTLGDLLGCYPLVGVRGADRRAADLPHVADLRTLPAVPTVGEALGDLPLPGTASYAADVAPSTYAASLRAGSTVVHNHEGWRHRPRTRAFLADVAEGGVPGGDCGRNAAYYSQAYARLHRDGLARTITTNFHNPGSGRFTHYAQPRSLTVREAARLQGLPDRFLLTGDRSAQERLVGNAFPVPWARAVAGHVARELPL